jgi:hypothetical protein
VSYLVNGGALRDDVMDGFISILRNGRLTRHNVGPYKDLVASFQYLGSPHKVGSAEPAPLGRVANQ